MLLHFVSTQFSVGQTKRIILFLFSSGGDTVITRPRLRDNTSKTSRHGRHSLDASITGVRTGKCQGRRALPILRVNNHQKGFRKDYFSKKISK